jgi:hypothetical protein
MHGNQMKRSPRPFHWILGKKEGTASAVPSK